MEHIGGATLDQPYLDLTSIKLDDQPITLANRLGCVFAGKSKRLVVVAKAIKAEAPPGLPTDTR